MWTEQQTHHRETLMHACTRSSVFAQTNRVLFPLLFIRFSSLFSIYSGLCIVDVQHSAGLSHPLCDAGKIWIMNFFYNERKECTPNGMANDSCQVAVAQRLRLVVAGLCNVHRWFGARKKNFTCDAIFAMHSNESGMQWNEFFFHSFAWHAAVDFCGNAAVITRPSGLFSTFPFECITCVWD